MNSCWFVGPTAILVLFMTVEFCHGFPTFSDDSQLAGQNYIEPLDEKSDSYLSNSIENENEEVEEAKLSQNKLLDALIDVSSEEELPKRGSTSQFTTQGWRRRKRSSNLISPGVRRLLEDLKQEYLLRQRAAASAKRGGNRNFATQGW